MGRGVAKPPSLVLVQHVLSLTPARPPAPLHPPAQEFDAQGLMRKRVAAINEAPIAESERRVAVEGGGPPVLNMWLAEQVGGVGGGGVGTSASASGCGGVSQNREALQCVALAAGADGGADRAGRGQIGAR